MSVLGIFGFLQFSVVDILDILMVALIIFLLFRWIKDSSVMNIVLVVAFLLIAQVIVSALGMKMMTALMSAILDVGVLAVLIIFQPEVRHMLNRIGRNSGITKRAGNFLARLLGTTKEVYGSDAVREITEACRAMSDEKVGALIVLPRSTNMDYIVETGDRVDAVVSSRLIRNIFFKNSPLHDGAMVISGGRIVAARCTLPITDRTDIPASYGMRHRAAIGLSEVSDADIIVVSEETGGITFINASGINPIGNINELKLKIQQEERQ
ncbi:MAG: diadenylate cyclase CdaA [Bacteroidales bacterium]|nr:diadenylate cyclase CdaA [Bacteroidales bacterium]